ncbi:MAG: biotin transporter BioY [Eubacteriales bacterium]|nr:biotin transporter BioY [Eubacteriales bacterium]
MKLSIRTMTMAALCAALLAILSQVSIPMPSGVPVTLQTMAVALAGCLLGGPGGLLSVMVYLLLGAAGLPVFAGFGAGIGRFASATGGFLWGFLPMAALCGLGARMKHRRAGLLVALSGVLACHLPGVVQFALLAGIPFMQAALTVSLPYLIKDALSVAAAWYLAVLINRRIARKT